MLALSTAVFVTFYCLIVATLADDSDPYAFPSYDQEYPSDDFQCPLEPRHKRDVEPHSNASSDSKFDNEPDPNQPRLATDLLQAEHKGLESESPLNSNGSGGEFGDRKLEGFRWSDCSKKSFEFGKIESISIQPDPVVVPGLIKLQLTASLNRSIVGEFTAKVKVQVKEGLWIPIPYVNGVGSCNYPNLCSLLPAKDCPEILKEHKIPCQCPIPSNRYEFPLSDVVFIESLPSKIPPILHQSQSDRATK